MRIAIARRPDGAYIEKSLKHSDLEEIEDLSLKSWENHKKAKA
jgi:hypothetical protein